jgi:hypothetical protein
MDEFLRQNGESLAGRRLPSRFKNIVVRTRATRGVTRLLPWRQERAEPRGL